MGEYRENYDQHTRLRELRDEARLQARTLWSDVDDAADVMREVDSMLERQIAILETLLADDTGRGSK
jgi:hypothetical protein